MIKTESNWMCKFDRGENSRAYELCLNDRECLSVAAYLGKEGIYLSHDVLDKKGELVESNGIDYCLETGKMEAVCLVPDDEPDTFREPNMATLLEREAAFTKGTGLPKDLQNVARLVFQAYKKRN